MSETPKYLRGDPDRPFPTDLAQIKELRKQYKSPTHEPLWFYRIRGTCSPKEKALYHDYQTIENIEVMQKLGIHMPKRAHLFKGIGLERERPYIEETIKYARELHKRGMLVSVYVGGTMFTEYFFKEVPEAVKWARRDQNNDPVTYGGYQLNRWFPCLNHPDYRAYTKKVLDIAVEEVEADEIFFDNQILRYEPRSCRCDYCVKHLRDTIKKNYTLDECLERYGVAEYPDSIPPVFSQACKPWRLDKVHQPNIQDWIDHRIHTVIEFYSDMNNHVKSKKPDTTVGMNIKGIHGHNRAFDHGICHGAFADILEWSCIDGYRPGYRNGVVVNEMRFFKSSHSSHITVVDGSGQEIPNIESAVVGWRGKIEGHGWLSDLSEGPIYTPAVQFLRNNQRMYHELQHAHEVAVLRSEPSTKYNCAKTHEQVMAVEQTLAMEKLPWGIIFDKQIDNLDPYRIIMLPDIQALSDKWVDALDAFMKKGGGVIASGKAGDFNGWYRSRAPGHAFSRWLGHAPTGEYECVEVGQGRFICMPEWDVQTKWNFDDWFAVWGGNVYPVKNRGLFRNAIRDARGERPLTHRAEGNDCVYLEAIVPEGGAETGVDLHFINYNKADTTPKMTVHVALPQGKSKASIEVIHCDDEKYPREQAKVEVDGDEVVFSMSTPPAYGIALVRYE